jgi:hypothetical protein
MFAAAAATICLPVFAFSAVITAGDPTTGLVPPTGPAGSVLFLDEAVSGGSDMNSISAASSGNKMLDLNGAAGAPGVAGTVSFTGFGFAVNTGGPGGTTPQNTAESITVGFRYNGADGTFNTSDDIVLGTTNGIVYHNGVVGDGIGFESTAGGTYYVNFDSPISGMIDGLNESFRITVTPTGGSIRWKALVTNGGTGIFNAKMSVAGTFVPVPEPATLSLVAGLGLMAASRRRRV